MVHFVQFEDVVVAANKDGLVRGIVDEVMRSPAAYAAEAEAIGGGELVLGESPNVVV